MRIDELPRFLITGLQMDAGIPSQASGVFDHLTGVIEGYCDLYVPPATFIIGKLYDLQPSARTARFTCKDRSEATAIRIGESYRYFDGYWGERARLSLHPALTWTENTFVAKGPYHHNHCDICWAAISAIENTTYMRSSSGALICHTCYRDYVLQRSIGFIVATGNAEA